MKKLLKKWLRPLIQEILMSGIDTDIKTKGDIIAFYDQPFNDCENCPDKEMCRQLNEEATKLSKEL